MKTILVPTDFSKNANNALKYAVSLAKKAKAKIILLHAYHAVYFSSDVPIEYFSEQLFSIELAAKKQLEALAAKVTKSGLKCEIINKQGLPVDSIIGCIKDKRADLLVMGTQGASGLKEVLVGSNTASVIGKATCPVITVPAKASFDGMKKIGYATNYRSSDLTALKQLVALAKVFKSRIKLIHIADGEYTLTHEKEYMEEFTEKIKSKTNYNHISTRLLESSDVEKKLEQYLKKESVNLFVVSTKHRNLIERFFGKSITKKLAYHSKVPLMVFHHKKKDIVFI